MSYLGTLRRIPDDIVLAIFAQDFYEGANDRCVCGWAVRERMARQFNAPPENVRLPQVPVMDGSPVLCDEDSFVVAQHLFGGSCEEWRALWDGAAWDTFAVEEAVVDRLNEIVA